MKNRFSKLLDDENIKFVIYVDDCHSMDIYKAGVYALLLDDGAIVEALNGWFKGVPVEQQFDRWWQHASNEEIKELVDRFNIQPEGIGISRIIPKDKLLLLSPDEFIRQFPPDSLDRFDSNNRMLILMDREIDGNGRKGDELLLPYTGNKSIYCTIFSATFSIKEELEKWRAEDFLDYIYPLSKERQSDDMHLIKGLRNVLWMRHIKDFQIFMNENLRKALEEVISRSTKCDPYAFDNAVMASSAEEGCWEYDTLQRLYLIQLDAVLRNNTKEKFGELQQSILSLRNINQVVKRELFTSDYLLKLREDEIFIPGVYLNAIHAPIDNGDMFDIEGKEYILLSQSCNLALRNTGTRKSTVAYLLPLIKVSGKSKKKAEDFREYLHYEEDGEFYAVKLNQAKVVALSVFDLTVFNDEGMASIDCRSKDALSPIFQPNIINRYNLIKKEFKSILSIYNTIKDRSTIKNAVEGILGQIFFVQPTIVGTVFSFNIHRTRRYRDNYANALLGQLTTYLSRAGFPNDFSKPIVINGEEE